ncbi:MAG: nucleoside kinase [Oscillospiraceae bacterium]|nr:nucleoside kinase [Oscillospiraceae bacterium]
MAYQLQRINDAARTDPRGFLEECDAEFQRKIDAAAERIVANLDRSPIVLLSGPSGSGKTTTAMKVDDALEKRGIITQTISMDNYFQTVSPETTPRTKSGGYDFESPLCMDMELLNEHFDALSAGREIRIPHYDFCRQMRDTSKCTPLRLKKNEVAVFEGIHALNDEISGRHPEATKIYISARSNVNEDGKVIFKGTWMRLVRRAVRDMNFRGHDILGTLALWANVRRGEKLYISPFKQRADIIFDSSLPYEVSVMKHFALPLLEAVPEDNPRRKELLEMIRAFQAFEGIDPDLVHPDSLIREFIGGGSYHY